MLTIQIGFICYPWLYEYQTLSIGNSYSFYLSGRMLSNISHQNEMADQMG